MNKETEVFKKHEKNLQEMVMQEKEEGTVCELADVLIGLGCSILYQEITPPEKAKKISSEKVSSFFSSMEGFRK